jgi:hypothetical protein
MPPPTNFREYDGPTKGGPYGPLGTMSDVDKSLYDFQTPLPAFGPWEGLAATDPNYPEGLKRWAPLLAPSDLNAPLPDHGLLDGWSAPNHLLDNNSVICSPTVTVRVPDLDNDGRPQDDGSGGVRMKDEVRPNKFHDLWQSAGIYDYVCNTKEMEETILKRLREKLNRKVSAGENCNELRTALVQLVKEKFAAEADLHTMYVRETELQEIVIEITDYLRTIATNLLQRYSTGAFSGKGEVEVGLLQDLPVTVIDSKTGTVDTSRLDDFVRGWREIYPLLDPSIQQVVDELEACNQSMPDMTALKTQAMDNLVKIQMLETEIEKLKAALVTAEQQVIEANNVIKTLATKLIEMGWSMNRIQKYIDVGDTQKPGEFYDNHPTRRPQNLPLTDPDYKPVPSYGEAPYDTAAVVQQARDAATRASNIKTALDNMNFGGPFQPFPGDWLQTHNDTVTGAAVKKRPNMRN